ncbi:aromatic amino acid aminotransferase [Bordetella genomosp. 10]|uniref:Aminotransferase n=1 Tax=Bordetella genomosp. 10 TaxID=1416804 RepID=A0A261SAU5_9BORD|nr:amino acid aminotransferase [Bordetella genomosp. 10]OZI34097.1 aromatic amino acid aminotransferase [Bordetella genomosp. 10]
MSELFSGIPSAPLDPIMRLFEAYNADPSDRKLNLVVGVYTDAEGRIPVLRAVRQAEDDWVAQGRPKNYRPIEGTPGYRQGVQALLFGADSEVVRTRRATTLQSVGGTGALKIGADVLKRIAPDATVAISAPSWENHRALFEAAGFPVVEYPYYDPAAHAVRFDAMVDFLRRLPQGSIVVLHACCHNPTGNDLDAAQWRTIVDVCTERKLTPFVDIAYQGFGDGLAEDALAVRLFAEAGRDFFVASSFSKSFSLYGERVGAVTIVCADPADTPRVEALAKRLVRTNYSNPPTHGAAIVETVLQTPALRRSWEDELESMRTRIRDMRLRLAQGLASRAPGRSFQFIVDQKGMFSYSGLGAEEIGRLRTEDGIYALDTGRICVAALNDGNIDRVVDAIGRVLRAG